VRAPEAIETELRRLKEMEARGETARDIDESKRRCERLAGFVREAWPTIEPANPYVHNWHIDAICEHLEALTYGRKLERTLSMLLKLKDLRSSQSEA
jgi:hypothetical protein